MNERGSVLAIAVLLLSLVIGIIVLVINSSYARFVRSELQAAADAAAHGGGKFICSSLICWDRSKSAAVDILSAHKAHGDLADDLNLSVPEGGGPVWDYSKERNLIVSIERGRYTLAGGFESMDTSDWDETNPGVPRHTAFNAIRVRIQRPAVELLGTTFASTLWSISSESVVIGAAINPVCTVPFAIPVCQLLNQDMQLKSVCENDTLFAASDRYCPANEANCDTRPSFPYEICRSGEERKMSHRFEFQRQADFLDWIETGAESGGGYANLWSHWDPAVDGNYCFSSHGTPFKGAEDCTDPQSDRWFVEKGIKAYVSDHYGVVGLPVDHVVTEAEVRDVLTTPTGCMNAEIGDPFSVLPSGLSESGLEEIVWNHIADLQDPSPDARHPSFVEAGLGTVERNFNFFVWDNNISCNLLEQRYGVCASKRFEPNFDFARSHPFPYLPFKLSPGINDRSPVWEVRVPVIANVSPEAEACGSTSSGTYDPAVIDADEFEIIGFVKLHLFDVSIGYYSPGMPANPPGLAAAGAWGFSPNQYAGTSAQCNLVRGRVSCDSKRFIATSDPSNPHPMFIQQAIDFNPSGVPFVPDD